MNESQGRNNRQPSLWLIPLAIFLLGSLPTLFGAPCFWRATIGIPCPTCGLSRAFLLAIKGQFRAAFSMHPLIFLYILVVLILSTALFVWLLRQRRERIKLDQFFSPRIKKISRNIAITVIIVTFLVYVIRMLSYFPDHEPLGWNEEALLPTLARVVRAIFIR